MARSSWKIGKNQSDKVLIDLDKKPDRFGKSPRQSKLLWGWCLRPGVVATNQGPDPSTTRQQRPLVAC
ncbi:hypothetical protein BDV41DRAFT_173602 [Aspergillus transmontanensis]|uniref:Uncharacterized protein n=1 Tax=Aspergillus transmontanensis TaxID=1034304 RepID=A0A5N6WGD1_9EURO|nr:hypothetical protein BDV41DRAFT_173602 [Aspergillus transmontanensis]